MNIEKGEALSGAPNETTPFIISFLLKRAFGAKLLEDPQVTLPSFNKKPVRGPVCTNCGHDGSRFVRVVESWRRGKMRPSGVYKCSDCGNIFTYPKMEAE